MAADRNAGGAPPLDAVQPGLQRRLIRVAIAACAATTLAGCGTAPPSLRPVAPATVTGRPGPSPTVSITTPSTPAPTPTRARTAVPAKVRTHPVFIAYVKVGACFNTPKSFINGYVPVLSTCAAPHDNQVMGRTTLGKGSWPGNAAEDARADVLCQAMFLKFVGVIIDDSSLDYQKWMPDGSAWKAGDRELVCSVDDPSRKTVGTLASSKR